MNAMKEEAIGGINAFLESQQKLPGEARLTLVLFDHEYIATHDGVPIRDVPPLDSHSYVPCGTTALLDAIGRTINTIGERLDRTPEPDRPGKVIIAIVDQINRAPKTMENDSAPIVSGITGTFLI
jgi:hypothetical protein